MLSKTKVFRFVALVFPAVANAFLVDPARRTFPNRQQPLFVALSVSSPRKKSRPSFCHDPRKNFFATPTALGMSKGGAITNESSPLNKSTLGMAVWFVILGGFIVRNYKSTTPWIPVTLTKPTWVLIHAICNMLFSGAIVLSTLLEWMVVHYYKRNNNNKSPDVLRYWFCNVVTRVDKLVVMPALTLSIVAGFAQTALDYGSMVTAPKHIRLAIHLLATFALLWLATDVPTQRQAKAAVLEWCETKSDNPTQSSSLPQVLYWRRASNVVSCLFVASLYALMALKPLQ